MRSTILALLMTFGVGASPVMAHTDKPGQHSHDPINKLEAEDAAKRIVTDMVRQKAVDPSWTTAQVVQAERNTRDRRQEWVITLSNPQAADPTKQTLYVFLSNTGGYIAANHTGR